MVIGQLDIGRFKVSWKYPIPVKLNKRLNLLIKENSCIDKQGERGT
jgi:hypothetical protein